MFSHTDGLNTLWQTLPFFADRLTNLIQQVNPQFLQLPADHIALRCNKKETAERWHTAFAQIATQHSSNIINGRPIVIFQLHHPLQVAHWQIDCLELPYPTTKYYQQQGWQHIELVVDCPIETFSDHINALLPSVEQLTAMGINLTFNQPKGEGETRVNPTFTLSKGELAFKLHPYSLIDIIESE